MPAYPADPEFDFLLRCTVRQPQIDEIPALDLDRLYLMASEHDVVPLLYRGLRAIGGPEVLLDRLSEEIMKRGLFYEIILPQHLAEILAGLQESGVPSLLLKGYALGVEIYRQPLMRPFIDYDLLLHPNDGAKAAEVLRALGYKPASGIALPPEHHHLVPYVHPERLMVELHSDLVTAQGAVHIDMDQVWAESRPWQVQGAPTHILCLEHTLIYLALHAVMTHLFEQGLKAICDVHELLTTQTVDWDRVIATSHAWGCARQVYLTLRLLNELYGEVVSAQVFQQLSHESINPQLLEYSLENLRQTSVIGLSGSSGLAEAWSAPTTTQRIRHILERLFPDPQTLIRYYHLSQRDRSVWLYYPRWQYMFVHRHLRTAWHLLRADPDTRENARHELIRRDLLAWVTQG